jgi:ectoine hydroxylase-related dioxygenase (phytanoyl-CoA dioxygenase family)
MCPTCHLRPEESSNKALLDVEASPIPSMSMMIAVTLLKGVFLVAAVATAFPSTSVSTRNGVSLAFFQPHNSIFSPLSRGPTSSIHAGQDVAGVTTTTEDVSTPASLIEEEMLQGPLQTFLFEVEELEREKAWKRLNKAAKMEARAAGSSGSGFGGAGKASKSKTDKQESADHTKFGTKEDKSRFGAVIMEQGVARINGRLSKATAASVSDFVNKQLEESLNPVDTDDTDLYQLYQQQTKFADVQGKHNRWDMLMPLEESSEITKALYELLLENRVLSETIESILGPSAQLYELGSLISDPGSERQMLHADYNYQPDFQPVIPPALTCFVALQDIESNMGPTTFLPSSATALYHQEIGDRQFDFSSTDGLLAESPNVLSTLGSGDCSIYNPMTLHCGGANRSEQRRNIFYFSFKNPKFNDKDWPLAYASLSPDLRARALTLPDIHGILKDWNNKANVVT